MSGRKVAGCCVHVASVIFYFSYARNQNLKLPALNKSLVLINTAKRQKPNNPTLVRVKRSKNNYNINNSIETEVSSSDESESEFSDSSSVASESNISGSETEHESNSETEESITDESEND